MASESEGEVETAARRGGESWSDMARREQQEKNNKDGVRELLRSLPDEQKQEKEQRGRGSLDEAPNTVVAEALHTDFQQMLRDASQRVGQEQDRDISR